jgi:DNA topoisomerase I
VKVPPARGDARIARSPSAKVHAVGYDPAGRLRYRYHDNYREREERFELLPLLALADRLPEMRRFTSNHPGRKRLEREKVFRVSRKMAQMRYSHTANALIAC